MSGENPWDDITILPPTGWGHFSANDPALSPAQQRVNMAVGEFEITLGAMPGDTRYRWLWPHWWVLSGGVYTYTVWDSIQGDGILITDSQIVALWSPIVLYWPGPGAFTPYP